jgi:hypothetical protein
LAAFDIDGEVIFATASTPTHLVFSSLPNMNCAYFRLRHQYHQRRRPNVVDTTSLMAYTRAHSL